MFQSDGTRQIPQDADAESALLGACLVGGSEVIDQVLPLITSEEAFITNEGHRAIWRLLLEMHQSKTPIDLVTAQSAGRGIYWPEEQHQSFLELLIYLGESFADTANAAYYAREVQKAYQKRLIISICSKTAALCYDFDADPLQLATEIAQAIDDAIAVQETEKSFDARAVLESLPDVLTDPKNKPIKTGLACMDETMGGLYPKALTVLAARTSMGKTSLAMAILSNMSANGVPCIFFSTEMSVESLMTRFLSCATGREVSYLRRAAARDEVDYCVREARGLLNFHTLWLVQDVELMPEICAIARVHVRRYGVKAIGIDYLQRCKLGRRTETYRQEISDMANAAKTLANETDTAVLLLSQVARSASGSLEVGLEQLKESGTIENTADTVIALEPADLTITREELPAVLPLKVKILKQRNGRVGISWTTFNRPFTRFEDPCQTRPLIH